MSEGKSWLIPEDTHKTIVHAIVDHFGFSRALSYEIDEEGKLYARYGKGIDPRDSFYYNGRVPSSGEVFDVAIEEKKELIIWDSGSFARGGIKILKRVSEKEKMILSKTPL